MSYTNVWLVFTFSSAWWKLCTIYYLVLPLCLDISADWVRRAEEHSFSAIKGINCQRGKYVHNSVTCFCNFNGNIERIQENINEMPVPYLSVLLYCLFSLRMICQCPFSILVFLIFHAYPGLSVSQEPPLQIQPTPHNTTPLAPCGHRLSCSPPGQTFIIPRFRFNLPWQPYKGGEHRQTNAHALSHPVCGTGSALCCWNAEITAGWTTCRPWKQSPLCSEESSKVAVDEFKCLPHNLNTCWF